MTMQAVPTLLDFVTFSEDSLQPDLLARSRKALESREAATGATAGGPFDDRNLLTQVGFLRESPQGWEIRLDGLLLFGRDEAISRHFPSLKTLVVSRGSRHKRDHVTALPLNLLRAFDEYRNLTRFTPKESENSGEIVAKNRDESLERLVLDRWFLEMAENRDYIQHREARFVRESEFIFLEYPKNIGLPKHPPLNPSIRAILATSEPTMQDESNEIEDIAARQCFGMTPIRFEGRFFKVMAPHPFAHLTAETTKTAMNIPEDHTENSPVAHTPPIQNHASLSEAQVSTPHTAKIDENTSEPQLTMQVERSSVPLQPKAGLHGDRTAVILDFCRTPRHRGEIQGHVGMNNRDHFRKEVLNRLIEQGLLAPTLPDKPNSPKQQYKTVGHPN